MRRTCAAIGWRGALAGLLVLLVVARAGASEPASTAGSGAGLRGNVNSRAPGYLGIKFRELPDEQINSLHLQAGRPVEILKVDHDGPAGQSGLHAEDIIVALNGQAIAGAEALRRMIHDAGAGVQIVLTVIRSGRPLTLTAQLGDRNKVEEAARARLEVSDSPRPPPPVENQIPSFSLVDPESVAEPSDAAPTPSATPRESFFGRLHSGSSRGAVMDAMEPQLASYFGAPAGMGLLVHSVASGSPAADAGLQAGDVVLRADLYSLRTVADWTKRIHAAKNRPVTLTVLRDRHEMTLTLQPELKHHSLLEWPSVFRP